MNAILKYCISSLLVLLVFSAQAQQDSLEKPRIYFNDFNFLTRVADLPPLPANDSITSNTRFYDILQRKIVYAPQAGNSGSAAFLVFNRLNKGKTFRDGFDQFEPYLMRPFRALPSMQNHQRFTNINFHLASKKEQHILISHEQHIRPWFYAGLDFGAMSSPGDFARQLNTNKNFRIWLAYEAPSKVYRNYVSFTSNKVLNQENGGITVDSVFENASSLNTRTLPINLRNAAITHKTRDYYFKQDLNLLQLFRDTDSLARKSDFTNGSLILSHAFWYHTKYVLFNSENPDSGFFNEFYIDSTFTRDSSWYSDLFNEVLIEYRSDKSKYDFQFNIGAGVNVQEVNYFTTLADTLFRISNGIFKSGLQYKQFSISFQFKKAISGDVDDSFDAVVLFTFKSLKSPDLIFLRASSSKLPHSVRDQFYVSNHFIWKNNFNLLEKYVLSGGIDLSKYRMSLRTQNIIAKNFLFYREDFLPQVNGDWVSYGEVSLANISRFGKFGFDEKVVLSYSGNENVIKVPTLALYGSIYFKDVLFKKALGFRAGADISYYSSYNGYGYMPATGVFYLQDVKKIGNYPLFGIFVDLKIKTAKIFIKLDHLNAGISTRNYYGAYHYPLPGRSLKFGINWDFVN